MFCSPQPVDHQSRSYKESVKVAYENLDRFITEGHENIRISGNDPIEAEKEVLFDLVDKASRQSVVELATNGIKCADLEFTRELINRGVQVFNMPIYGSTEEIHQSVIHNGSLSSILEAFENIVNLGGYLSTLTALTKRNADDIVNILNVILAAVGEYRDSVHQIVLSVIYIPYIGYEGVDDWYLPFGQFVDYMPDILEYVENNKFLSSKVLFVGFPFCVFGKKSHIIINHFNKKYLLTSYKKQVGTYRPASKATSDMDANIPSYRVQVNPDELCTRCIYKKECGGIPEHDYRLYGIGKLRPIESV